MMPMDAFVPSHLPTCPLPEAAEAVRAARSAGAMSVAFFEFQHKPPLLETAFEFVHRHLARGDAVRYRFLGHDLPATYMSPIAGSAWIPAWLPERTASRLVAHPNLEFVPRIPLRLAPLPFAVPDSLAELMSLHDGSFDVGMAVASSLISQTRNSSVRPLDHPRRVRRMLQGARAVYDFVTKALAQERPDLVYVYNGRYAYERAVVRACQALKIPHLTYEIASTPERFYLRPHSIHDRVRVQEEMRSNWIAVRDRPDATDAASRWFGERRDGQPRDWPSFTSLQTRSRLPARPADARLIAYFSSSDDEFVAIGDAYRWEGWANQFDAVRDLIEIVASLPGAHLVVRLHPHLIHKHPSERARWMTLEGASPSVTVIAPESDVDTYALVDAAAVVVTGGSTVGVEAVFWGRPSILLGPADYDELGVVHRPHDAAALRRLLLEPALGMDRDAALAYGYHRATFGEPYIVYRPASFVRGSFLGADLRPWPWRALAGVRQSVLGRLRILRHGPVRAAS